MQARHPLNCEETNSYTVTIAAVSCAGQLSERWHDNHDNRDDHDDYDGDEGCNGYHNEDDEDGEDQHKDFPGPSSNIVGSSSKPE